ncbi:hypothetical protein AAD018_005600 [Aestuariibius insulae]|uniref:hypothetical protein n=1 Tax=Aestuariibius insulae TaxID=2058287 RepID=UPI00345F079C
MQDSISDASHILKLPDEDVPAFIRQQILTKSFSTTVRNLNADMLSTNEQDRSAALTALKRLGLDADS